VWLDPQGNKNSIHDIIGQIQEDCEVFVGSDSQYFSGSWIFASVICLYWPGRGGRYFYIIEKRAKTSYTTLEDRLLSEVYDSVMVADEVRSLRQNVKITIHADIGIGPKNKSSKIAKLAENYIKGMGFQPQIKPDAWAAATIADRLTKTILLFQ
jgi:predicted RNase H-related nuclease YkuK (DUF458 family)